MSTSDTRPRAGAADLDDESSYQALDPEGMLRLAVDFPAQVKEAAEAGRDFRPPANFQEPRQVVLAGMGGSAVAGDFLARLCERCAPVPIVVCRNYDIPCFVGPETLFIASSHSGNADETRAAASAALRRRARLVCVTTGGKLGEFAQRHRGQGVVLLQIPKPPRGMRPRTAFGYSFVSVACLLESLGLYPGAGRQVRQAIPLLEETRDRLRPRGPTRQNRAKQLAEELFGKIPWIQGTAGIMSAAAYRWRCQFNENSKTLAYSSEYPELNHNEAVGWEHAEELGARIGVVALRRPGDHPLNRARVEVTRDIVVGRKASFHVVEAEGGSPLAQVLWTVYLGDFTSLYLAFLNGVNPALTSAIEVVRGKVAASRGPRK